MRFKIVATHNWGLLGVTPFIVVKSVIHSNIIYVANKPHCAYIITIKTNTINLYWENSYAHSPITGDVGFIFFLKLKNGII